MNVVSVSEGMLQAYCPACKMFHYIPVGLPDEKSNWYFNNNFKNPTLSPSILFRGYSESHESDVVCHSFIRYGKWRFLDDSSHSMAGKVVNIENKPKKRKAK